MISVIIPLYNKESCILNTIRSILSQSFEAFEIVIVDDGSTDRSVTIVKSISDIRIRLVCQENAGPSAARNCGVREAQYDWILFLDADDILLPGSLLHFAELIQAHPDISFFCSNHYSHIEGKKDELYSHCYKDGVIRNNFRAWAFHRCGVRAGTGMFKKELLLRYPYDETLRRYEDSEVLFRMMHSYKIYRTSIPTVLYNCNTLGASVDFSDFSKDFLGHLDLNHRSFYERVVMFQLFYQANRDYPIQSRQIYKKLYHRYDLRFICRIVGFIVHITERFARNKSKG